MTKVINNNYNDKREEHITERLVDVCNNYINDIDSKIL